MERGRRLAEAAAVGRRIGEVWCADDPLVFDGVGPDRWRGALEGRQVLAARRWGKQLWLDLDAPPHPLFHFGMSGGFRTPGSAPLQLRSGPHEDAADWPPRYAKIRLRLDDGGDLVMTDARRIGRILLRADPEHEPPVAKLGFDPLLAMPTPRRFCRLLRARDCIVKSLLLDQSFAAGVGNWIADEALFQAGINPRRRTSALTDAEARRLRAKLGAVVRRAVKANADPALYPRTWLFHRRWGKSRNARTAAGERIEHVSIAGRTTAWVPARQR